MSRKSKASRPKSTTVLSTMVLLVIFAVFTPKTWARYSGGTGEPNDPYQIATAQDLNDIGNHTEDWNKNFVLVNDVNLAEYTDIQFRIIGGFKGIFDGNDHKVWSFTWSSVDSNGIGMFGYLGEGGQIKNLGMENVDVNAATGRFVGGLVVNNSGTITNCYLTGYIDGNDIVGSLVGFNYGIITDCYSSGNVSGKSLVGGLTGYNGGTITNCHSAVSISQTLGNRDAGGLVGHNSGTITNCYSTGDVSGDWGVGGLVGSNFGTTTNCYSTASVTGYWSVGGLAGRNMWDGTITNSYSIGTVSGGTEVGGLVGQNNRGFVSHSYSTVSVIGRSCIGGLVARNYEGTITDCYSTGNVLGNSIIGGLVGDNNGFRSWGMITNCYSRGGVAGEEGVGGLVGYNEYGDIESSFWDVETSGEPNMCGGQWLEVIGCDPNCGKTTAEMKTKSTFTDAGWDFIETWGIGEHQTYPYLLTGPAGDLNYDKEINFIDLAILASHWLEGY